MYRRKPDGVLTKPQRKVVGFSTLRLLPVGEKQKRKNHVAQTKPLTDFFESESFNNSEVIYKRKQRDFEIAERERNKPPPEKPVKVDYDFDVDWFSGYTFRFPPPISIKKGCHQAIRKPLALSFGKQTVSDVKDWSDKPFSTLDLDYKKAFPLLLKRVSEAEEKDLVFVKTETRRHSIVTTDYMTGNISLTNNSGKETKYHVFPLLYEEPESSSSGSDMKYPWSNDSNDDDDDDGSRPTGLIASKESSEESIIVEELAPPGWPAGWNPKARRSSIAGGPKLQKSNAPRVVRRTSMDYGGMPFSFRIPPAMETLKEDSTSDDEPNINREDVIGLFCHQDKDFDIKHAEETMEHLNQNLETLENFLKNYNSISTISNTSICSVLSMTTNEAAADGVEK
ncbi:uncharacterized protein [Antedon mediterranea]|uniref:uncharacterized protein n=1 Tax=Antedon mediterranea TaxID=105859 RepID=UPI003AF6E029